MTDYKKAESLGFLKHPRNRGEVYCRSCFLAFPAEPLTPLRTHAGSSHCEWRVACGAAELSRLRVEEQ